MKSMLWLDMPTIGDASESALIKFFQPIEDIKTTRGRFPAIKNKEGRDMRLLFSSVNKFAFSINLTPKGSLCLFTKGAPEKVWKMCTHVLVDGKAVPKDDHWEKVFQESNEYFGSQGERVLGFARLELPNQYGPDYDYSIDEVTKPNFPLYSQCFVGIVSLNDPPRDAVPFAVTKCHTAGVKVIMVTGDQPVTATAIARDCNIISEEYTVH
jgi:sodium/potassium-transporting ATPase subunit alpha